MDVIPDQRIVVDQNIITSFCPETAAGVAYKLLAFIADEKKAKEVAAAMGYEIDEI